MKRNKLKKIILNIIKLLITLIGLYLAYGKFDWNQLQNSSNDIDWSLYAFSLFAAIIILFLNTLRLQFITLTKINFWNLLKINFIAKFFSLFLPTSVGGDIVRTVSFNKYTQSGSKSLSIIFIDRFIGMTAMISLGTFLYLLPMMDKSSLESWISYIILGTFLLILTIWAFIWSSLLSRIAFKILQFIPIKVVKVKLKKLYKDILDIKNIPNNRLAKAFIISILGHIISSVSVYTVSTALRLQISATHFFISVPVINTLLLIPLSINGIGVRDYLFKNIFEPLTNSSNFILLAPLAFLVNLIIGLIGGIMYLFQKTSKE